MKLTKNFSLAEFHCKDGTEVPEKFYPNVKEVARNLQILRDEIGEPLFISGSGYRSPKHNKAVGGAPLSQHLTASAADISAKNLTPKQLKSVVERLIKEKKIWFGGVGLYRGFIHVDIRKERARW